MTRRLDDHDFSDRGLDIRPPRPEENEYLRDVYPRLCASCGEPWPCSAARQVHSRLEELQTVEEDGDA